MSWKLEIFRAFFVALGAFQVISNSIYLIKENGLELAARQHQEIPPNLKKAQIKAKVICMLLSGILFLMAGLYSYFTHSFQYVASVAVLAVFAVYAVIEACCYRYWRTICFSCLSILFLVLLLLGK